MPQMLASLEMLEMWKVYTVTLMMGTNDVSIGESRKMKRLQEKVSCILDELRVYLDPTVLTICTITHNMMADQNAMSTNEMVRHINGIIGQVQQRSVLPVELLDFDSSSDGIHFDKPKANGVAEWCLSKTNQLSRAGSGRKRPVHLWSTPNALFLPG